MQNRQAPAAAHELHLSLAPRTIDEIAQVWEAMQQPYRLSVCYEVRAVRIESLRRRPAAASPSGDRLRRGGGVT